VRDLLEGKRVILVDDSIVRGTTSRKIVRMVREAGATEVHVRISSPPTISPCYYGIDTPTREELIASSISKIRPHLPGAEPVAASAESGKDAASQTLDEIQRFLEADSLGYLSLGSLREAVADREGRFCTSCFTGVYPTEPVQLEVNHQANREDAAPVTVTREN
jgi:amidophosphoribosyltransferase